MNYFIIGVLVYSYFANSFSSDGLNSENLQTMVQEEEQTNHEMNDEIGVDGNGILATVNLKGTPDLVSERLPFLYAYAEDGANTTTGDSGSPVVCKKDGKYFNMKLANWHSKESHAKEIT
uniref:C2H2-type domain-containing protein n=1 Tax=Romanomermis culicivorax TaxID=13658 RepID=A0A915JA31_ROMCU